MRILAVIAGIVSGWMLGKAVQEYRAEQQAITERVNRERWDLIAEAERILRKETS